MPTTITATIRAQSPDRFLPRLVGASVLVVCTGLLAACGSSEETSEKPSADKTTASSTPSASPTPAAGSSPTPPPAPACEQVWVAGKRLPNRYSGCQAGGSTVAAAKLACESGQQLVTYADRFYAVRGGPVIRVDSLRTNPKYAAARHTCIG